jgi:hypothetical protein
MPLVFRSSFGGSGNFVTVCCSILFVVFFGSLIFIFVVWPWCFCKQDFVDQFEIHSRLPYVVDWSVGFFGSFSLVFSFFAWFLNRVRCLFPKWKDRLVCCSQSRVTLCWWLQLWVTPWWVSFFFFLVLEGNRFVVSVLLSVPVGVVVWMLFVVVWK